MYYDKVINVWEYIKRIRHKLKLYAIKIMKHQTYLRLFIDYTASRDSLPTESYIFMNTNVLVWCLCPSCKYDTSAAGKNFQQYDTSTINGGLMNM